MENMLADVARSMDAALAEEYPNKWVILLADGFTGELTVFEFERTDMGKVMAAQWLLINSVLLPLHVLVFTNLNA